ncbi:MAG: lipopolysaccharide biosynthesis protein [Alphaproteobacteria bacterium]
MRGAIWLVGVRWLLRGLGLISISVLARLLTPADFGIVAMAMIVVALVDVMRDFGIDMALIRLRDIELRHYHTAWTLALGAGLVSATLLLMTAPVAAWYFDDHRLRTVISVLALVPVLSGLENIKTVDFRRNFNFRGEFVFNLVSRVISVGASIALALWLRSYWALVYGTLAQACIRLAVGYAMVPFLPRLSLRAARELWSFSVWILVRSISQIVTTKIDQIVIGRLFGATDLGGYNTGREITSMATLEVVLPLGRALLPGYAKILGESGRLQRAYEKVLSFHFIIGLPLGVGFSLVAHDLVPLLLGHQWLGFIPVFQVLALAGGITAVGSAAGPLLIATGEVRTLALITWAELGISLLVVGAIAAGGGHIVALAWGRLGISAIVAVAFVAVSAGVLGLSALRAAQLLIRPIGAVTAMAGAVVAANLATGPSPWFSLLVEVVTGAAVYGCALFVLWTAMGRPEGAEKDILEELAGLRRLARRGAS